MIYKHVLFTVTIVPRTQAGFSAACIGLSLYPPLILLAALPQSPNPPIFKIMDLPLT